MWQTGSDGRKQDNECQNSLKGGTRKLFFIMQREGRL